RPASLVVPPTVTLRTDAAADAPVRVRVLDASGVPVGDRVHVSVAATGVILEGTDSDPGSLGEQRRVGSDGWLELQVRGAHDAGQGRVLLSVEGVKAEVALRTLPTIHPLVAVGAAQVALTGASSSYGAITMRGALDAQTAVSVSYDSRRRTDDDRRLFGRDIDPLDGARFPAVGDGSERRVLAPATGSFAARVERGFDWLEFGDVRPSGFSGDGRLLAYQRSLTGVNGRVTTGDVTWNAFGSLTAQRLEQRQLRALGSAGPFLLGSQIRPGTERVFVEVRARENAARVIERRELQRVTDYEISYETGALLLRRAVPATDLADNPIFIVALVERRGAGDRKVVGGLRAELDLGRRLGFGSAGGLTIGTSVVHDEAGMMPLGTTPTTQPLDVQPGGVSIVGADVRLRARGVDAQVELVRADVADSAALAGRAEVSWKSTDERLGVDAKWMRVGQGFAGSLDPRLSQAVDELNVAASMRIGDSARAELTHRRERYADYGVERATTSARTEQRVAGATFSQELGVATDELTSGIEQRSGTAALGRLRLSQGDARSLWVEGTRALSSEGGASPQPDRIAAGAGWRLFGAATAELKHEWVSPVEQPAYQLTGVRLRSSAPFGRVWGGLDRADAARTSNSAILGIEQRVRFAKVWSLESAFERRMGLGAAAINDPLRALPFAGPEPDYWTAAFGASFLPGEDRPHATVRVEHRDARDETTTRMSVAGDAPLG
ncbi:MAG TPA: hypothetical protein VEA99_19440, partial [Gemmatimonadaceae bacterium]|nr:hypothetical protein [Gemmatimonadaceae bacterium]